jgi:hypothetical protein
LRDLGVPLTGGSVEGLQAEFAEIYGVFCGAEESITILCSGKQPSFVFRRIAQMAGGETFMKPGPVAAMAAPQEAAAWLARYGAMDVAENLGLTDDYRLMLERIHYRLGNIDREHIPGLYGSSLTLSASQIDHQADCRLSYFFRYGLRVQERKPARVDPAEFGTYVHDVLEHTARDVMKLGGFEKVSLEQTLDIAQKHSAKTAVPYAPKQTLSQSSTYSIKVQSLTNLTSSRFWSIVIISILPIKSRPISHISSKIIPRRAAHQKSRTYLCTVLSCLRTKTSSPHEPPVFFADFSAVCKRIRKEQGFKAFPSWPKTAQFAPW